MSEDELIPEDQPFGSRDRTDEAKPGSAAGRIRRNRTEATLVGTPSSRRNEHPHRCRPPREHRATSNGGTLLS
jgi:hypothetical protein